MRLLFHTINYGPELTGIGKYTGEMCAWFAARGHEVTVVAPPPYYPEWKVALGYSQWRYQTTIEENVRVRRAPIWIPKRPGGLARVLYGLSFAASSFPLMIREAWRADVVFVIEPSFLNAPVAWIAARIGRARTWLHIQDYELDLAYDLGQLKRGRGVARRIESMILRRFDVVSSISRRMLRRAESKGAAEEKLFLLPNFFDDATIFPQRPGAFRKNLGIAENVPLALYSGSLGAKQGIDMILEAAKLAAKSGVQFLICGDGVASKDLRSRAKGMKNVRFLPLQPPEKLNALLNAADIHLLPQRKGASESVLPSKLIGMLASGRPVVAMARAESEVAELVEGCGLCVDHEDAQAFARAIETLAGDKEKRSAMGRIGRQRALACFRQSHVLGQFEARLFAAAGDRDRAREAMELLQNVSEIVERQ